MGGYALEEKSWWAMKNQRCRIGLVMILSLCILFLSGCWGKREVEELAPLIGVGFDLGQKPGSYLITEQFALPKKGGASAGDIEDWTISVEASSARESLEMISKILNREPFMGSLKIMVIGEDAAKAGFIDIIDFAQRYAEFRRSMYLVLAKGKAQDVLNIKLRKGELPAMYLKSNIETSKSISTFPTVRLGHYLTVLGTKSTAPIIPMVKSIKSEEEGIEYNDEGDNEPQELIIKGAGVFRGDHLIDYLSDQETKGYMWLENQVEQRLINTVDLEGSDINFAGHVIDSKTKYKLVDDNGTKGFRYQIRTNLAIDEVLGLREKLSDSEWLSLMSEAEKRFTKVVERECWLAIEKEKKLSLDFLGIGRHIEQEDTAYWKTIRNHWEGELADFPVSLDVKVTIHNAGMSNNNVIISTGEGQE